MDNLHVRLTFNPAKTKYSLAKFANLCIFVLREEKVTIFSAEIVAKVVTFSSRNTNIYKCANFARQNFPCFTTFRHQTWQFF